MPEKVFANTSVIQYLHCLGLIKSYLDKLSDIGFYLSKEHRNLILKKADEAD